MHMPLTQKEVSIQINDPEQWDEFLDKAREARGDAQATGGNYSAFLPHKHGSIQISFAFPLEKCAKKRKRGRPKGTAKKKTTPRKKRSLLRRKGKGKK